MLMVIGKRLLVAIPSLIGVVIVTFLLTLRFPGPCGLLRRARRHQGGDPGNPREARPRQVAAQQFIRYVRDLAKGDLGQSLTTGQPVVTEIRNRLPASAELTLLGLIVSVAIAIPSHFRGVKTEFNGLITLPGGDDRGRVVPVFFTGLILVYVFYYLLGWAPAPLGGSTPSSRRRSVTNLS